MQKSKQLRAIQVPFQNDGSRRLDAYMNFHGAEPATRQVWLAFHKYQGVFGNVGRNKVAGSVLKRSGIAP